MAVKDRGLYNPADINSYFRDGVAKYQGKYFVIVETDGDKLLLSDFERSKPVFEVRFRSEDVSFPIPKAGCFQCGPTVRILSREPHRQYKKAFRLREAGFAHPVHAAVSSLQMTNEEVIAAMFAEREATFGDALSKVMSGEALSHILSNDIFISVTSCGNGIGVYHRTDALSPLGYVVESDGSYVVKIVPSANPLRKILSKLVETIV